MIDHLSSFYRQRELHLQHDAMITKAVREGAQAEDVDTLYHIRMPSTRKAAGYPLQIMVDGRPTIGSQRGHWRPDRIADCRQCGRHCTCPD